MAQRWWNMPLMPVTTGEAEAGRSQKKQNGGGVHLSSIKKMTQNNV